MLQQINKKISHIRMKNLSHPWVKNQRYSLREQIILKAKGSLEIKS